MIDAILKFDRRPIPYEESTSAFWNDGHISKGMLEAHINPNLDSATRSHAFVESSVRWIADMLPPARYNKLLDLGCGPGIYAELFHEAGYRVTGVDLSMRSIEYARDSATRKSMNIDYTCGNYLDMGYRETFDLITLIYCDFGVLSDADRKTLLQKAFCALKPGGSLLFDVFTEKKYRDKPEFRDWSSAESGFWSGKPHLCLHTFYRYDDTATFLDRYIVATEDSVNCYNVWEHVFTPDELRRDLTDAGFNPHIDLHGDVTGAPYIPEGETICVVATRPGERQRK